MVFISVFGKFIQIRIIKLLIELLVVYFIKMRYNFYMKTLSIPNKQSFKLLEFETNEFEHLKRKVDSWKLDFLQIDNNDFYVYIRQLVLANVQVGHIRLNGHIAQNGQVPENMWTFVIPHQDSSIAIYNHLLAESNSMILIYPPGTHFSSNTYDGFENYTFSIEEKYLKKVTTTLGLDKIEQKLHEVERVELDQEQTDSLQYQLENILKYAANKEESIFHTEELEILLYLIPAKIIQNIHPHMECSRKRLLQEKHLLYIESRSYMHTHIHEDLTVKSVAEKFGLTERTLHNYFKKELDISPKRYLMVLRLRKIHKILKKSRVKKGLIEETARKFGFYHMGQFAKSYKDFFGELPSQTLREE